MFNEITRRFMMPSGLSFISFVLQEEKSRLLQACLNVSSFAENHNYFFFSANLLFLYLEFVVLGFSEN